MIKKSLKSAIGLGMKPNLTGRGKGVEFVKAGIAYAKSKYNPKQIILSVAIFNQRAIKVYKKMDLRKSKHLFKIRMEVALNF